MKNLVLFDFDGVIVDSFAAGYKINVARFHSLTPDEFRQWFNGNIGEEFKKRLTKKGIVDLFKDYHSQLGQMAIVPGIAKVIVALAKKYTLIIISSTYTSSIKKALKTHGLEKYFDEFLGYDVETSKVIKIRGVLKKFHLSPKDCILITDTLGDIREAREAGVESVAVTWGYHDKETLERGSPCALISVPADLIREVDRCFQKL